MSPQSVKTQQILAMAMPATLVLLVPTLSWLALDHAGHRLAHCVHQASAAMDKAIDGPVVRKAMVPAIEKVEAAFTPAALAITRPTAMFHLSSAAG